MSKAIDKAEPLVTSTRTPPDGYKGYYNRFVEYVDKKIGIKKGETTKEKLRKYLTQENVDSYFKEVVAHLDVQPKSATKIVAALQWFSNYVENHDSEKPFQIRSGTHRGVVESSLEEQHNKFAARYLNRNHDAHSLASSSVHHGCD